MRKLEVVECPFRIIRDRVKPAARPAMSAVLAKAEVESWQ
jgi:hypothetical protein